MKLSKFSRAKLKLSTASDRSSLRKAVRTLLDFQFITPKKALFIARHSK